MRFFIFIIIFLTSPNMNAKNVFRSTMSTSVNQLFNDKEYNIGLDLGGVRLRHKNKIREYSTKSFDENIFGVSYEHMINTFSLRYEVSIGEENTIIPKRIYGITLTKPMEEFVFESSLKEYQFKRSSSLIVNGGLYKYSKLKHLNYIYFQILYAKNQLNTSSYKSSVSLQYFNFTLIPFLAWGQEFLDEQTTVNFNSKGLKLQYRNIHFSIIDSNYPSSNLKEQEQIEVGLEWNF